MNKIIKKYVFAILTLAIAGVTLLGCGSGETPMESGSDITATSGGQSTDQNHESTATSDKTAENPADKSDPDKDDTRECRVLNCHDTKMRNGYGYCLYHHDQYLYDRYKIFANVGFSIDRETESNTYTYNEYVDACLYPSVYEHDGNYEFRVSFTHLGESLKFKEIRLTLDDEKYTLSVSGDPEYSEAGGKAFETGIFLIDEDGSAKNGSKISDSKGKAVDNAKGVFEKLSESGSAKVTFVGAKTAEYELGDDVKTEFSEIISAYDCLLEEKKYK